MCDGEQHGVVDAFKPSSLNRDDPVALATLQFLDIVKELADTGKQDSAATVSGERPCHVLSDFGDLCRRERRSGPS